MRESVHGGAACPHLQEIQPCKYPPCYRWRIEPSQTCTLKYPDMQCGEGLMNRTAVCVGMNGVSTQSSSTQQTGLSQTLHLRKCAKLPLRLAQRMLLFEYLNTDKFSFLVTGYWVIATVLRPASRRQGGLLHAVRQRLCHVGVERVVGVLHRMRNRTTGRIQDEKENHPFASKLRRGSNSFCVCCML